MGLSLVQKRLTECLNSLKKPPVSEAAKVLSRTVETRRKEGRNRELNRFYQRRIRF
jgi:hypothetical protein